MRQFPPPRLATVLNPEEVSGTGDVPMLDPMTGRTFYVSPDIATFYGDQTREAIAGAAAAGHDTIGFLPLLIPAGTKAVQAVENAVANKKAAGQPAPTAPTPSSFDAYGNPVQVQGAPNMSGNAGPFNIPGGYLGADDHVSGTPIGYDDEEVRCGDATGEDSALREDDAELDEVDALIDRFSGDMGDIGDVGDAVGDGVGGDEDEQIGALSRLDERLSRRDERIHRRLRKAKRRGRSRRVNRLERRRHRLDRLRRRIHAHRHRRAARRAARAHRHMMPLADHAEALELIANLPVKGELQRIPLLSLGLAAIPLTAPATAANTTVTQTATTAGISYASLRFLGLLVQVSAGLPGVAGALAGPMSYRITSAQNDGGIQVIYGSQLDVVTPEAVSSSTKGSGAVGSGIMWIPGLRDKPLIRPTGTIKATIQATYHTAGQKTVSFATIEAIFDTVKDPQAGENRRVVHPDDDDNEPNDDDEED